MKTSSLTYDDVLLVPQYSEIRCRSDVDISSDLGKGCKMEIPLISAPMDTVSESAMGASLAKEGAASILHRYNTIEEQVRQLNIVTALNEGKSPCVGAAIGVAGDVLTRARTLVDAGVGFLCIDVAHGHHIMMKEALRALRSLLGDGVHNMAGNIATLQGLNDLADWGADSVRCNIGGGSICSTRIQTGHGLPGFQTILDVAKTDRDIKIIADGGITNSGDIVKALAAGADAVMCGSLFAGTDETPGKIFEDTDGSRWKSYRGMASKEAQVNWRGRYSSFEGVATRVPYRGSIKNILEDLERGIRSGFSYSGAATLAQLHAKAQFVRQTSSGLTESGAHITRRKW